MNINTSHPCKSTNYTKGRTQAVKYIVIHYVGATGTALQNVKYYGSSEVKASAHFYVGHASESGAIYQSVDPANTAWHCGGGLQGSGGHSFYKKCLNSNSIGIELCCHNDTADRSASSKGWYIDAVTIDKAVELTKYLMDKYNVPVGNVIRHYDVTGKTCPNPFVLDESKWKNFKERLEAKPVAKSVPAEWAKEEADWAVENGLIKGDESGDCKWQENLTREQFAVILKRYYDKYGK